MFLLLEKPLKRDRSELCGVAILLLFRIVLRFYCEHPLLQSGSVVGFRLRQIGHTLRKRSPYRGLRRVCTCPPRGRGVGVVGRCRIVSGCREKHSVRRAPLSFTPKTTFPFSFFFKYSDTPPDLVYL